MASRHRGGCPYTALRYTLLLWQWPPGGIRGRLRHSVLRDSEEVVAHVGRVTDA